MISSFDVKILNFQLYGGLEWWKYVGWAMITTIRETEQNGKSKPLTLQTLSLRYVLIWFRLLFKEASLDALLKSRVHVYVQ